MAQSLRPRVSANSLEAPRQLHARDAVALSFRVLIGKADIRGWRVKGRNGSRVACQLWLDLHEYLAHLSDRYFRCGARAPDPVWAMSLAHWRRRRMPSSYSTGEGAVASAR